MKMNSNSMLCGSASNGIVVTDLPVNVLVAMRDSIDAAIKEQKHQSCVARPSKVYHEEPTKDDYIDAIREAIAAAHRAGYDVCIGDELTDEYADISLEDDDWDEDEDDEDDWDDDDPYDDTDDEGYDYDPCQVCHRKYCEGCRLHDM